MLSERIVPSTLLRKPHLCIPRKGVARPQSQFPHSCVSVIGLCIPRIGPHIFQQQTDTWMCKLGLRSRNSKIFVSNFQFCVFVVDVYCFREWSRYLELNSTHCYSYNIKKYIFTTIYKLLHVRAFSVEILDAQYCTLNDIKVFNDSCPHAPWLMNA